MCALFDEQYRDAAPRDASNVFSEQRLGQLGSESRGGLIEYHQGGTGHQHAADRDHLSLAATEVRGRAAEHSPEHRKGLQRLLEEEHQVMLDANAAYEAYRPRRVMKDGRRFGRPPDPFVSPEVPEGSVNITGPDSRNLKCPRGYNQGYNAQAVVTEEQIVVATEINADSPDFGHLEPMIGAVRRQLRKIGIFHKADVVVADAGYWHTQQMDSLAAQGIPLLIPPDAGKPKTARPGWEGGLYTWVCHLLATEDGHRLYRKRQVTAEPVFAQTVFNRKLTRFTEEAEPRSTANGD